MPRITATPRYLQFHIWQFIEIARPEKCCSGGRDGYELKHQRVENNNNNE